MDMRQNISSGVSKSLFWQIHNNVVMHFCRDILIVHNNEKTKIKSNYCIEEWHTSTKYNIFRNQSAYPTVCLLLDTWHRNDHCITGFGKYMFDSNLKVALPLTHGYLNYKCRGHDTDENKFIGFLNAIILVPIEVGKIKFNMK